MFFSSEIVAVAPEFNLGKNTKEMVALRSLEGLFVANDGSPNNVASSSGQGPEIRFDFSQSCEDVLHQILLEVVILYVRFCE